MARTAHAGAASITGVERPTGIRLTHPAVGDYVRTTAAVFSRIERVRLEAVLTLITFVLAFAFRAVMAAGAHFDTFAVMAAPIRTFAHAAAIATLLAGTWLAPILAAFARAGAASITRPTIQTREIDARAANTRAALVAEFPVG